MMSKRTFRCIVVAVLLVLLAAVICLQRARSRRKLLLGSAELKLVDVPIPEDIRGPYGLKMCVSPDGKQIAVSGGVAESPAVRNPGDILLVDMLQPQAQRPFKAFEKTIYTASVSSGDLSYEALVKNCRMCVVLAMAISQSEPYQLASGIWCLGSA